MTNLKQTSLKGAAHHDLTHETPLEILFQILYKDEQVVAIHKPAGLLLHPSPLVHPSETLNCVDLLQSTLKRKVFPVHRLDRATSGLVLFALNSEIARHLAQQFAEHQVEKTYHALVRGIPRAEVASGDAPSPPLITLDRALNDPDAPHSPKKTAQTQVRVARAFEIPYRTQKNFETTRLSWLALYPRTGRRHQLRRHLAGISHPMIGDTIYGSGVQNRLFRDTFQFHRLALAATEIRLEHPRGQTLHLHAPLAPELSQILARLTPFEIPLEDRARAP